MIVHTDTCYTLHTAHTSYQLAVGPGGVLLHTYYGPRLPDSAPCLADSRPPHDDPGCWTDLLPKEWSAPAAARQADIDLFVLDDGWFKGRSDTTSSLGDWTADRNKLPGGLPELCARLNDMDMELGLWVEPEAVSPDSDLYRAHPDWALAVPGRRPVQIRHQYTLDLSRPDVVDGIWQQLEQVLRSCPIRYLKWDMNRALADVYSTALPAARQGEVYHRYVLGLYELQRRLAETFPDLLLENCAGGGVQLAGADGIFRDARAVPDGPDRILADCGALRHPCAVRYAWYNYGPAGLYGGTGLPAAPFGPQTLND